MFFLFLYCLFPQGLAQAEFQADYALIQGKIRQGNYQTAAKIAYQNLQNHPDDPQLNSLLGIARSRIFQHVEADIYLSMGIGSDSYVSNGAEAHALSLRALGQLEKALQIHSELLWKQKIRNGEELRLLFNMVDDYRLLGDHFSAFQVLDQMHYLWPRSALVHALAADLHLDMGEIEEAEYSIWLANLYGKTSRAHIVMARLALHDGRPEEAATIMHGKKRPSPRMQALYAELLRLSGQPEDAEAFLYRPKRRYSDDPYILVARLYAEIDAGYHSGAQQTLEKLELIHPNNPLVKEFLLAAHQQLSP